VKEEPGEDEDPAAGEMDKEALLAPHLCTAAPPVEYQVAVPTYRRWRPVRELTKRKRFKDVDTPFILALTLDWLGRQLIPVERVTLFVADEGEATSYFYALQGSIWAEVRIVVAELGIKNCRNFIYRHYPEGTYIISVDDDVERMTWKVKESTLKHTELRSLPPGGLEKLIYEARQRMSEKKAFLWGLNTSQNPMHMHTTGVSERNGLVNGYVAGYINRPSCPELLRSLTDASEDAEFSVRHFAKDGIVLRFRMYSAVTTPYWNAGGLRAKFEPGHGLSIDDPGGVRAAIGAARKEEERVGAAELCRLFPLLIGPPKNRHGTSTQNVNFLRGSLGGRRRTVVAASRVAANLTTKCGRSKIRNLAKKVDPAKAPGKPGAKRGRRARISKRRASEAARGGGGALWCNRPPILVNKDQIAFGPNAKRPGTAAYDRYERYKVATTKAEAQRLGAMSVDLIFDLHWGHMWVTRIHTEPRSREVELRGELPALTASGRESGEASVDVRIHGMKDCNPGVAVPRWALRQLSLRCPALRDLPEEQLANPGAPLETATLEVLRVLLCWAETGALSFPRDQTEALCQVLRALDAGGVARRVEEADAAAAGRAPLKAKDAPQAPDPKQNSILKFFQRSEKPPEHQPTLMKFLQKAQAEKAQAVKVEPVSAAEAPKPQTELDPEATRRIAENRALALKQQKQQRQQQQQPLPPPVPTAASPFAVPASTASPFRLAGVPQVASPFAAAPPGAPAPSPFAAAPAQALVQPKEEPQAPASTPVLPAKRRAAAAGGARRRKGRLSEASAEDPPDEEIAAILGGG